MLMFMDLFGRWEVSELNELEAAELQAQAEDLTQPHGVADDLGRKPVPGIGDGFECHAVSLARPSSQSASPG